MNYYTDIKIKPDNEMSGNVLLNKVYTKLHLALSSAQSTKIGISFPNHNVMLGNVIRIHGDETNLLEFQSTAWLDDLFTYCKITQVQKIPEVVSYQIVSRIQANMTEAKLRRLIKRNNIPVTDIKKYRAKMCSSGLDNPYLELDSISTEQHYRRYLTFRNQATELIGDFDHFGLSKTATVPQF